ncbi:MAG TPA: hypothetical protein VFQ78_01260 [Candidatus Udaeobacter sp.]|jgi:hypothetical protein|nr:hypothetical protein [Candidatus Udaeobacter sp.]
MDHPIICFGQQPCGFFPKRFLFAKISAARRLQKEIGGEIVFFFHDSDHDPRETITILRDQNSNQEQALNFHFENRIQKQFSPLFAKRVVPEWREKTARQLPNYVGRSLVDCFKETTCSDVAAFCLEMYTRMGLLEGVRVERSGSPEFRARAVAIPEYFVDQRYEGEIVRARYRDGKFLLHKGGDRFLEIPGAQFGPEQISPTRDTRFRWMQSVIQCTHYIAGASEQHYMNKGDAPGVKFVKRDEISDYDKAYTGT